MKKILALLFCVFINVHAMWYVDSKGYEHKIKARTTISKQSLEALEQLNHSSMESGKVTLRFSDVCNAIRDGNKEMVSAWLSIGGKPDAISIYSDGCCIFKDRYASIFLSAIKSGNTACVQPLLIAGAQPQDYEEKAIKVALKNRVPAKAFVAMIQLLIEYRATVSSSHLQYIDDANIACLPLLLEQLHFEQLMHTEKRAILSKLIQRGSAAKPVLTALLKYNVGLNVRNKEGETLLHDVVRKGQRSLIELLIQNGAHLLKNKKGKTPKDIAKEMWGKQDSRFWILQDLDRNSTENCNSPKYVFSN